MRFAGILPWPSVFVGLAGAALVLLGNRGGDLLWAWRYLAFVSWPVRVLLALAIVAIAFLPVQDRLGRALRPALRWPVWLLPLIGGAAFWVLRERTYRGDGLYKLALLGSRTLQDDPYVWKEPLDALAAYTVAGGLRQLGVGPDVAVALLSVLAGVVYLIAVIEAGRRLAAEPGRRALAGIGLLALGTSQLWFGHVENYSLVTAFCTLSVALALGYLVGERPLWLVGLTTGAAVSFHPQALFALPALLTVLDRRHWMRQAGVLAATGLLMPSLTVALMLMAGLHLPDLHQAWGGGGPVFWSLSQALAPTRLLGALNNLWLVAPMLPLLVLVGAWATAMRTVRHDRRFRYLAAVALGFLAYNFSFRNELARWYDWDLFAIVGPMVTAWGLYVWLKATSCEWAERRLSSALSAALPPALAFAVAVSAAWVVVNHSYTLLRVVPAYADLLERYRIADLTDLLPQATVSPDTPFCADPASDPTACRRVTVTEFTMPQNGDARPVIFSHAPARVAVPLRVPRERSFLWLSPAVDPLAWDWGGDGVTFEVHVVADGTDNLAWRQHLAPDDPADRGWKEVCLRLDAYQGEEVTLVLVTDPGPAGDASADRAGWGRPWLMRGTPEVCDGRP